jgi:hypothetical protein
LYSVALLGREDLFEKESEDSVGSAALGVHLGLPDHSVAFSPAHEFKAQLGIIDDYLVESLDVDAVLLVFVDEQFLLFGCPGVVLEQVRHLFVVQLQEGAVDLDVLPALGYQSVEEQVDGARDEAGVVLVLLDAAQEGGLLAPLLALRLPPHDVAPIAAEHGVRLPTACLPVRQQGHVEPLHGPSQQWLHQREHFPLRGLLFQR